MLMVEKQWINTQQKTFTKWYDSAQLAGFLCLHELTFCFLSRLNNKIKARDLNIEDLVKDLSDGVGDNANSKKLTTGLTS